MVTTQKVKPILVVEDESIKREFLRDWLSEEGLAELDSWDEEGRVIVEQIISRSPYHYPYYFKKKRAYFG